MDNPACPDILDTMEPRTDPHSPTNLVTEDYEFLFCEVNRLEGAPGWVFRMGEYGLEMARRIASTDRLARSTHQCHHCGAHLNYFAVLEHTPSGDLIVVGETCLANRFERATADFQALRKQAQLDREKFRIRTARDKFVAENPDLAWMNDPQATADTTDNDFVADVAAKLRRYGSLSDKQIAAVRKAVARDTERAERMDEPKAPVPSGRIEITGTVLATRWQEGYHGGGSLKMLVRHESGWKVWGSVPSAIRPQREDTVRFTATIEPSDDDEAFGFFKRPAKAEIIHRPTESETQ